MTITNSARTRSRMWTGFGLVLVALLVTVTLSVRLRAQSFSSGSDGSDGALTIAQNAGTVVFNPMDTTRWGRILDPDGDGVYNFTTITIGSGSTLRFLADTVNRPVYLLASGDVIVDGSLDASGAGGTSPADVSLRRLVSIPGPGGYAGGAGGSFNTSFSKTSGEGPGGGTGGVGCIGIGSPYVCGRGGTFTGNRYLVPLVGGSGGEGALFDGPSYNGGGAGGGAVLIASSSSITLRGSILATGGQGANGVAGSGSGGAIRLVAPTLAGSGHLDVRSIGSGPELGSAGLVRLEAVTISPSFIFDAGGGLVTRGSPVDQQTLRPASSLRVTAIDGIPVPPNPSGSLVLPDVTISKNSSVNVDLQATGIPPGTVVTLQVYPQTPTDLTVVNLPTAQATLTGTLQASTATATFTFPYGFSRGFVRATWTQ